MGIDLTLSALPAPFQIVAASDFSQSRKGPCIDVDPGLLPAPIRPLYTQGLPAILIRPALCRAYPLIPIEFAEQLLRAREQKKIASDCGAGVVPLEKSGVAANIV
jgi:hypothetical protein